MDIVNSVIEPKTGFVQAYELMHEGKKYIIKRGAQPGTITLVGPRGGETHYPNVDSIEFMPTGIYLFRAVEGHVPSPLEAQTYYRMLWDLLAKPSAGESLYNPDGTKKETNHD